jgi:hypothetical protein
LQENDLNYLNNFAKRFINEDNLAFISLKNKNSPCDYIAFKNSYKVIRICENNYVIEDKENATTKHYNLKDYKIVFNYFNIQKETIDKYLYLMKKFQFKHIYSVDNYILFDFGSYGYLYTETGKNEEDCDLYNSINKINKNWYEYYKKWDHTLTCL